MASKKLGNRNLNAFTVKKWKTFEDTDMLDVIYTLHNDNIKTSLVTTLTCIIFVFMSVKMNLI